MLNRWPPAMWALVFMLLGILMMVLALFAGPKANDRVLLAFITTGAGIVTGAFAVFQHTQGVAAGKNSKDPTSPAE